MNKLLTPVAGSNLLAEKVFWFSELSQNSNSERLFQSKTSNLVKWTKLISADFPSNSPHFTSTLGAFPCTFLFRKEPFNCMGNLWIHSTDITRKNPQNSNSEESSENREIFSASKFDRATGVKERRFWPVICEMIYMLYEQTQYSSGFCLFFFACAHFFHK